MALSKKSMFKIIYFLFMFIVEREWLTVQTLFLTRCCFDRVKTETETVVSGKNTMDRQTNRETDRQTDRQKDRKTERQKDRKTERQTDRLTDRQTQTDRER